MRLIVFELLVVHVLAAGFLVVSSCATTMRSNSFPLAASQGEQRPLPAVAIHTSQPSYDERIWAMLKEEFDSQFAKIQATSANRSDRAASAVRVENLQIHPANKTLSWCYVNDGDYDGNGEVGISDITPVAINYLRYTTDGIDDDYAEKLADGNNDGQVNIADITPIAVNYGRNILGFKVYHAAGEAEQYIEIGFVGVDRILPADGFIVQFPVDNIQGGFAYVSAVNVEGEQLAVSNKIAIITATGFKTEFVAGNSRLQWVSNTALDGGGLVQVAYSSAPDYSSPFTVNWATRGPADWQIQPVRQFPYDTFPLTIAVAPNGIRYLCTVTFQMTPVFSSINVLLKSAESEWTEIPINPSDIFFLPSEIVIDKEGNLCTLMMGPGSDDSSGSLYYATISGDQVVLEQISDDSTKSATLCSSRNGTPHIAFLDTNEQLFHCWPDDENWNREVFGFHPPVGWPPVPPEYDLFFKMKIGAEYNERIGVLVSHVGETNSELRLYSQKGQGWSYELLNGDAEPYVSLLYDSFGNPSILTTFSIGNNFGALFMAWNGERWITWEYDPEQFNFFRPNGMAIDSAGNPHFFIETAGEEISDYSLHYVTLATG